MTERKQGSAAPGDILAPREPMARLQIAFGGDAGDKDHPIHDISACVAAGDALFLAGDEAHAVERVTRLEDGSLGNHRTYELAGLLDLADAEEEMDIEGLAIEDGWLWVTGSHSRTRPDPRDEGDEPDCIDLAKLADLKDTRARCLLARIPLVADDQGHFVPVKRDGKRRAGLVRQGGKHGSKLGRQLVGDPLLGPFTRLAAKEGGLDIEGLATAGERVALGLRGPVIRTFAVILEPAVAPRKSGKLHLGDAPCLRLLDLAGLGVRDLRTRGEDLWILAGPTQDHDGRCAIFRWQGWAKDPPQDAQIVRLHAPEHLFDLPIKPGYDHAEGIAFWTDQTGETRLLVVYDSPDPTRLDIAKGTMLADLFAVD